MFTIESNTLNRNFIILASFLVLYASNVVARNTISIVGSSTVYPFTTVVAEQFGKKNNFKTPKVESTGTGGGMKLFCSGVGSQTPDLVNASRKIKQSEIDRCKQNNVIDIVELKVGYDGIVIASERVKGLNIPLTTRVLFLALAKEVLNEKGMLVSNPYVYWQDINPNFPRTKIEVLGPPPTSGTRDALAEVALEKGAQSFPLLKQLRGLKDVEKIDAILGKFGFKKEMIRKLSKMSGKKIFNIITHSIREDGAYIEMGENDNLIIQKLRVNSNLLGVFGYSFMDQSRDLIRALSVDGEMPEFEEVASGAYPIARSLYVYIKAQHVGIIPGVKEFVTEYTRERAFGEDGYLVDKGLIPLSKRERELYRKRVKAMTVIQ